MIRLHPFRIVLAAEIKGVLREALHGFGGGAAQRRDGGVIQINQTFRDGELVAVLLPQRPLIHSAHQTFHRPDQKYQQRADHDAECGDDAKQLRQRKRFID